MDEARDRIKWLDKHHDKERAVKLLVGARADKKRELIDQNSVDALPLVPKRELGNEGKGNRPTPHTGFFVALDFPAFAEVGEDVVVGLGVA